MNGFMNAWCGIPKNSFQGFSLSKWSEQYSKNCPFYISVVFHGSYVTIFIQLLTCPSIGFTVLYTRCLHSRCFHIPPEAIFLLVYEHGWTSTQALCMWNSNYNYVASNILSCCGFCAFRLICMDSEFRE